MKFKLSKNVIAYALLIAVILIGFILRCSFAVENTKELKGDAKNYDTMTIQYLEKGFLGYNSTKPNAAITPGYVMLLAVIYKIFGYSGGSPLVAVRIIQAILGTLSAFLIYLIATHISNRRVGIIAAALYAVYPPFILSVQLILTELSYTFFFLLYFWLQLKAFESDKKWVSIITGGIFAVAILIRPMAAPLFILPFVYQWFVTKDKKILTKFLFACAGAVIVMMPWWLRNYISFGKIILLSRGSANPLYAGAFPYMDANKHAYVMPEKQFSYAVNSIINGFLTQPILYLKWFTIGKLMIMFQKPWYDHNGLRLFFYMHYPIVILGPIGILFSVLEKKIRLISLYVVGLLALQLVFVPTSRYAYPIMPFLILLTAFLLDYLFITSRRNVAIN